MSVADAVPNAGATDDEGKPADLSEYKDKNGVVLYMFPQADTPG
jgi:peroxiredoxin